MVANYPTTLDDDASLHIAQDRAFSGLENPLSIAEVGQIDLVDASRFPDHGWVTIRKNHGVDEEHISYSGKSSNSLTGLTRALSGTTAGSYVVGQNVYFDYSKAYHEQMKAAAIAIETELGTEPSGGSVTVKARLDGYEDGTVPFASPTILSFVNALHDHTSGADGGGLGADTVGTLQLIDAAVESAKLAATIHINTLTTKVGNAVRYAEHYDGSTGAEKIIAALADLPGGTGTVRLAAGFDFTSATGTFVDVTGSDIIIEGDGPGTVCKNAVTTGSKAFFVLSGTNITLRNLRIENTTGTQNSAVFNTTAVNCRMDSITVEERGSGSIPTYLGALSGATGCVFSSCTLTSAANAINFNGSDGRAFNNTITDAVGGSITMRGARNQAFGNYIEGNTSNQNVITFIGADGCVALGNVVFANGVNLRIEDTTGTSCVITGNSVIGSGGTGFIRVFGDDCVVTDNTVDEIRVQSSADFCTVTDNTANTIRLTSCTNITCHSNPGATVVDSAASYATNQIHNHEDHQGLDVENVGNLQTTSIEGVLSEIDVLTTFDMNGKRTKDVREDVRTITGNETLTVVDDVIWVDASGGAVTVTLPTIAGVVGKHYVISKIDSSSNAVTVDGNGANIIGNATLVIRQQWDTPHLVADSAQWGLK